MNPIDPPGYQLKSVESWLHQHVPQLAMPLQWTKLEGGHSNLTYQLSDAHGKRAVIRRPPMGELLPKAHDMGREWSVIKALNGTAVPVPAALGFCADTSVTGAAFYVMGHIDGHPLYKVEDTERWIPPERRMAMANSFIDVLSALHAIDPDAAGLSDLGKKEDYVARQIKTWYRSWNASIAGAGFDDARAHSLQAFFLENIPAQGPARIVHGDYGVHNCLFGPDATIAAVVDWEICTLGDPLADLGYALNNWGEPADKPTPRGLRPTSLPGFPDRQYLAQRYAKNTGRDLSLLDYYIGFNHFKSAAIVHGVYARYLEGKKSTAGVDLPALRTTIEMSLEKAQQAVDRLRAAR